MNKILSLSIILMTQLSVSGEGNLNCENLIDFSEHKGQTYLSFMKSTVKPVMDTYAREGYELPSVDAVTLALESISSRVTWKVKKNARSEKRLLSLVHDLNAEQSFTPNKVNLYSFPERIASVDSGVNRYAISTFLGLVSCAGAIVKYAPENYAYNIHYGTGDVSKDERTGRSFGEGPTRKAEDASDKNYLKDLEEFTTEFKEEQGKVEAFYETLIQSLVNSDSSGYSKIPAFGQTLLTDFLAVYTAEQARNLMDGHISLHWDAALLEVTLLAAFHSGQEELAMYFTNTDREMSFTSLVQHQDNGCSEKERKTRSAAMYDYWQFSKSTNTEHCRRSGINITKREFRKLGKEITTYQRRINPELVIKIEKMINKGKKSRNLFQTLSKFFISSKTADSFTESFSQELSLIFTEFLMEVRDNANFITEEIQAQQ